MDFRHITQLTLLHFLSVLDYLLLQQQVLQPFVVRLQTDSEDVSLTDLSNDQASHQVLLVLLTALTSAWPTNEVLQLMS